MAVSNDEPLAEPEPESVPKPLECGNEQKLIIQNPNHNKHRVTKGRKTRRGNWKKGKHNGPKRIKFSLLGTNCNGLANKMDSLKSTMMSFQHRDSSGNQNKKIWKFEVERISNI